MTSNDRPERYKNLEIKPLPNSEVEHLIWSIAKIVNTYNLVHESNIQEPSQAKLDKLMILRDTQVMYHQELALELEKN
jgi:hypothetical protein